MCGRFSRARQALDYVVPLLSDAMYDDSIFRPSWNAAPGQKHLVIYPDGPRLEGWGYRPGWAVARKVPMMINARLDKANSSAWKAMWKSNRIIVPADSWYEWVKEEGVKQPYLITPIDGEPLYFAGLSSSRAGEEPKDGFGFVIVTDAAEAGMLDVHDRRPLVLSAQDARHWLEPSTTFDEAHALATDLGTPAEAFRWFPVSKSVNSVANNVPELNEPIQIGDGKPHK